jgi:hypothetical protein
MYHKFNVMEHFLLRRTGSQKERERVVKNTFPTGDSSSAIKNPLRLLLEKAGAHENEILFNPTKALRPRLDALQKLKFFHSHQFLDPCMK